MTTTAGCGSALTRTVLISRSPSDSMSHCHSIMYDSMSHYHAILYPSRWHCSATRCNPAIHCLSVNQSISVLLQITVSHWLTMPEFSARQTASWIDLLFRSASESTSVHQSERPLTTDMDSGPHYCYVGSVSLRHYSSCRSIQSYFAVTRSSSIRWPH